MTLAAGDCVPAAPPALRAFTGAGDWRLYHWPTCSSSTIASSATSENQEMLACPRGTTMKAASSGPIDCPACPPTWNSDWAKPWRPPEAMRAMRVDSGWKIDEPVTDQRRADQQQRVAAGVRQHDQPDQRAAHAGDQREGLRPAVGIHADDRLQQRGGELERQRDQADLAEVEAVGVLDDGIDGRQQRLHHVVEQMREAERQNDGEGGFGDRAEAAWRFGGD